MKYRILITKTLDVPKNVYNELHDSEEAAVKAAQEKLLAFDADVAIVTRLAAGEQKVIHRFERIRKAG